MMTTRAVVAMTLLAALASRAPGQGVFRSGVDAVEVDASVTRGNSPVAGLTADDFQVLDNDVEQELTLVEVGTVPLQITLVLDISASVSGRRLSSLIKAGHALIEHLHPADQVALVSFSHHVELLAPMGTPPARVGEALSGLRGSGATALRDAVFLSLDGVPRDGHARSLVLVFSDGEDTVSWLSRDQAIDAARTSNAVVHIVHFGRDPFLGDVAEATGGRTWSAGSDRQLEELFTRVLDEMRARYIIRFTPTGPRTPGWHKIEVKLKGKRGEVTARPGYFVGETR